MIVGVAMLQFIVLKRLAGKLAEQQPEIVRW
jgi:hypothetical protein